MPDFFIAIPEGALGASVGATLDVLSVAHRSSKALGRGPVHWRVIGTSPRVKLSNGLQLAVDTLEETSLPRSGALVFPGLGLDHSDLDDDRNACIQQRYDENKVRRRMAMADSQCFAKLAATHRAGGGQVAASCSGVLLLAMARVLDGQEATTHWQLGSFFRQHFPRVRLDTHRMIVDDHGLVTAGAAMAQMDLMLYLIRQRIGRDVAELTMRYLLIDSRTTQARYQVWDHLAMKEDDTAQRFETLVEVSMPNVPSITQAADLLHMTAKTMARRIFRTTGLTPMSLVNDIRMRHARRLLALGELPSAEVANRVGYVNATSLHKLTMKLSKLSPASLRPKPDVN